MTEMERNNMKVLIIPGTPKTEGLSCSCVNAVYEGLADAGSTVELIRMPWVMSFLGKQQK